MSDRKTRTDKGTIKIMPRDVRVLSWIGEMYAVRFDTLAILLAQEKEDQEALDVGGVYAVVKRWQKAGFVESRNIFREEPNYVWLTSLGLKEFGFEFEYRPPALTQVNHYHQTNRVRLLVEQEKGFEEWVSERTFRNKNKRIRYTDGIAYIDGKKVGIEVQLSREDRDDYDKKLSTFCDKSQYDFDRLWIYTTREESVKNAVLRYGKKVGMKKEEYSFFRVIPINEEQT